MAEQQTERPAQQPAQQPARPAAQPSGDIIEQLRQAVGKPAEPPPGPNATTDPENPAEHYYLASDGETKVNAYGEEIGSKEDKARKAAAGLE